MGREAVRCSSVLYNSDSGVTGGEVTICDGDSQWFKTGKRSTGRALPFQAWRGFAIHIAHCSLPCLTGLPDARDHLIAALPPAILARGLLRPVRKSRIFDRKRERYWSCHFRRLADAGTRIEPRRSTEGLVGERLMVASRPVWAVMGSCSATGHGMQALTPPR